MPSLTNVVLHIVLTRTLVGEVCQPVLLARKVLVEVEKLQSGRGGLTNGGGEDGRLQGGQGGLELRWNEGQGRLLYVEALVEGNGLGDERGIELEEAVVKELRPVPRDLVALLLIREIGRSEGYRA